MDRLKKLGHNLGLLWLRVIAGASMAYLHGWGKVQDVPGFADKTSDLLSRLPLLPPLGWAWAAALAEFAGAILLAVGLLTRFAALAVVGTMGVAFVMVHNADPTPDGGGELALIYGAVAGALFMLGGGKYSIDQWLKTRKAKKQ